MSAACEKIPPDESRTAGGRSRCRLPVAVALTAAVLLNGCAGQTAPAELLVTADDSCSGYRQPIAAVQKSGELNGSDIATAVAVGAVSGVVTGLLTGNAKAGLFAAVGGVALTAGARYYQRQEQLHSNRQELLASIYQDESKDGQVFAPVQAGVHQLRACRRAQFNALLSDVRARRLSQDAARAEFQKLLGEREHDNRVVQVSLGAADRRVTLYQDALQQADANQLNGAVAQAWRPPPAASAQPHPLKLAVDQARRADDAESRQTDKTIDALHVLLG
jgi:outer membrane murein-binding lipoprotein Lpp